MRRILTAAVAIGALSCTVTAAANPAAADTALGTSFATGAKITPGGGTTVTVSNSGDISGVIDFVTPVLNQVVQPLAASLQSLPSAVVAQLATQFAGNGAESPATPQSPPASGYPDCTQGGWTSDSCFGPAVPAVTAGSTVSLASGTVQGWAAADATGAYSAARTADPQLTVLGVPLGDLGISQSTSTCRTGSACTTAPTLTALSLLGGKVAARTAGDGTLQVSVNGSAFAAATTYTTATGVSTGTVSATVQAAGTGVVLTVSLTADQLLAALGLPSIASVGATDAGSTVRLTITLGTGATTTTASGETWGLEVEVGLDARIALSVLGLVTINVTAPNTANGSLADLKLAYSNAQAASTTSSGAQPDLT